MRYVKAATLLGGACLLALAVGDLTSRRDVDDAARRDAVEHAADLAAARLDRRLATVAASIATESASPARLGRVLDADVCPASDADACGVAAESLDLALEGVAGAGWTAVVLDEEQLLVAADRAGETLVAVVPTSGAGEPATMVRRRSGDDRPEVADLDTEFASGRWALRVDPDDVDMPRQAFDGPAAAAVVAELAVGGAAVAWALSSLVRDLRGLRRQATTDALTGLPNRAEFERRASTLLARLDREGGGACLLLVDLDEFKQVNDVAGHAAGDRVLIEAAGRLRRSVRESDIVGRWGGDEFVVLLAGVSDPLAVPDRVATIEASLVGIPTVAGGELTASVGAAVAPLDGRHLDELLDVADRAMYRSKAGGSVVGDRRLSR